MRFALVVLGAPYASEAGFSALRFARAALASGHGIYRVFFYADGVYCAQQGRPAAEGAPDLTAGWQAFAKQHAVELAVCVGASARRGIQDEKTAQGLTSNQPAPGFEITGLGQLIDAAIHADRLVTFGA